MEKEEAAAEAAAQAESTERAEHRKEYRKKMQCDICQTVATVLDKRIREELPENKQIETGFRLLPDGTRRVETMLKVQILCALRNALLTFVKSLTFTAKFH